MRSKPICRPVRRKQSRFRSAPAPSGPRPDFLCPAQQFGSFHRFLLFGFGWRPLSLVPKRNARGPFCKPPRRMRMRKTAVLPENSGSPQKFAGCASRGETNNSIRFVPLFFAVWRPVSCPLPRRNTRSARSGCGCFSQARRLFRFIFSCQRPRDRRTPTRRGGWTCRLP
jgi:hypothetical protein